MAQIFIDAATKQHPHISVGAVVIKNENEQHEFTIELPDLNNNEAEWATLIFALRQSIKLNITQALIYTDSKIVVDSISKRFVKDKSYKNYLNKYFQLEPEFTLLLVSFISRENNKHADHLAKRALYKYLNKG